MLRIQRKFVESCLLILMLITLFLLSSVSATAQELTSFQNVQVEVASTAQLAVTEQPSATEITTAPVYQDFMGVTLGMDADEVRAKLRHLKDKGARTFSYFQNRSRPKSCMTIRARWL